MVWREREISALRNQICYTPSQDHKVESFNRAVTGLALDGEFEILVEKNE